MLIMIPFELCEQIKQPMLQKSYRNETEDNLVMFLESSGPT